MGKRLIAASFTLLGVVGALAAADDSHPPDLSRLARSGEVRAADGALLRPFLSADGHWRLATTPADVSPRYIAILKAYEDRRFDSHAGIDAFAVLRAAKQYWNAGHVVSGASTLTMQVARLLEPPRPRGIFTKLIQAVRAVQLELRYPKDEILSFYLTLAPFGGNLEGVRAASLAYFGKEPKTLTLAEAALLVALPQAPERARPDRRPKDAAAAREKVLARLMARGALPADEAREARAAPIPSLRRPMPMHAAQMAERLAHEADALIVATTLDSALQKSVETLTAREAAFFDDDANLAVVIVKTDTRKIIAELGGANYWGPAGHIDLASQPRSPGSALKPFIYGMAFDDLALHPATMMQDEPTAFGDYAPNNFDGAFQGEVTARDALRMSLNVPAVMVLERVGPLRFTLALEHAGAKLAFPAADAGPSLPVALGGLGISLRDLTMLYAGLADGTMRPLHETSAANESSYRMFGPASAYYVRDILTGAALPDGWAMGQGLKRARSIGFKTGTSYGYRDAWAVGFSNDYTVGVWVGIPSGAPRPGRMGRNDAGAILLQLFDLLPADTHIRSAAPAGVIMAATNDALPASLRRFSRITAQEAQAPRLAPPAIAFPPDGSIISLAEKRAERNVALTATGGRAPLTWMVNGAVLGTFDRYTPADYMPDGEGFARITVIDAEGKSATSRVKFKKPAGR